ncbi:preATP grasp domain-containing protein [Streptomyces marianii]|uniref:preATP grasp domain-containing protein n=1 Tax=Streptomyces marianii TaxID=1817406 RepID=UPI001485EA0D|nr:peptide ligase PGM1-related protein [Streptomyces marianii]
MTTREHPRLIFGNFVNELMVATPTARHAKALVAVSPRKIWLTQPGDVVVLPTAASEPLWEYACGLLGFARAEVTCVAAPSEDLITLTDAVRKAGLTERLRTLAEAIPGLRFQPFALDRPALDMAAELGLPVDGYDDGKPSETALEAVYRINTKPGFRDVAAQLGIQVAAGRVAADRDELVTAARETVTSYGGAVVKPVRGSNGYGVRFLSTEDLPGLEALVDSYLSEVSDQPRGWVVEQRLDLARVVTVEMEVTEAGPQVLHVGEMRTPNGSFSGQVTPLEENSPAVDQLTADGLALGRHLDQLGYRGPFDIDGGITGDGQLYATESNLRRTGATYLDLLVRRFLGTEDAARAVWLADSRPGDVTPDFATGLALVREAGLAFEPGATEGVVLTADTLAFDGKWRYLVMGTSHRRVEEIEKRLADVLRLA